MSKSSAPQGWRTFVFKNRGLLLAPAALSLVIFGKPTVASAVAGIAVAAIGELLRIWAVGYSGVTTRAEVVMAPQLVTAGPYSYVRNPLYIGNTITALGFWLAFSGGITPTRSLLLLALLVVCVGFVYATIIPLEESYLVQAFGAPYQAYVERVPRIVPSRGALHKAEQRGSWRSEVILRAETVTLAFFTLMTTAVIVKLVLPET